ncbi:Na+/H+ antiporter NhaC family protein [Intestinibacillus massiliensis]|uniref:Na+/H+ antiporter NhaC family protein n=1 Tax=Intestinibacillus massiliensis TaxID=1871029 RepID=UPI000B3513B2|nr:Na+/H+ antiporter NhaC family protein [Intestinibacillus massiliensis]MCB6366152.1 Na+/H+ antiporter NhaC family protein [Intestinibacillus massiliensis]
MSATFWALLPPVIAIALALLTKEVYMSLMIGILSGALLFSSFNPLHAMETTFTIMGNKIGGNVNIMIFLVLLGILVALITKSGASRAYGEWATRTIKTRRGALLSTSFLGALIFVDDYFNCLTVGTVMRPVTDTHRVTRAKLAYVIDATAAPVCIIAPISSWAAAVSSSLPEGSHIDGFSLFLQTIPFNLYALLTLCFLLYLIISDFDFGPMKKYEERVLASGKIDSVEAEEIKIFGNGKVYDLILPIAVLIVSCIAAMLYTGGILESGNIVDSFANCDSSTSLVLGSFFTLIFTFLLYLPRKILTFQQFCESFIEGFRAMAPALMILTLAWTLSGICSEDYLNIGGYVKTLVEGGTGILAFMPAVFFLVALGLAFATGTSWGTFGILIPIAFAIFGDVETDMLVLTVAAALSGAVCGDHVSPISDTTILASAGGQCNHIDHVSTQMPYALMVAACCFVGYIVAGLTGNGWIGLGVGFIVLVAAAVLIFERFKPKKV